MFFDFRCQSQSCGAVSEAFVKPDTQETPCPECNFTSKRLISAPRIALSGIDPDFPSAYDKWERTQKQKRVIEKKHYDRHGVDLTFGGDVKP